MKFHCINTNEGGRDRENYKTWLSLGYAFTNGDESFGETLRALKPGDLVFMFVSGKGIKAVGMVIEEWDGREYREPIISSESTDNEFRIRVNWFIVLTDGFFSAAKAKEIVGYAFWVQTRSEIRKRDAANELLREMLKLV